MRKPFNVYMQGGLTYEHGQLAINAAAKLIGSAKPKKKEAIGNIILDGEKDETILKACESILKSQQKNC